MKIPGMDVVPNFAAFFNTTLGGRKSARHPNGTESPSNSIPWRLLYVSGITIHHGSVHAVAKASGSIWPPLYGETGLLKQCSGSFSDCSN